MQHLDLNKIKRSLASKFLLCVCNQDMKKKKNNKKCGCDQKIGRSVFPNLYNLNLRFILQSWHFGLNFYICFVSKPHRILVSLLLLVTKFYTDEAGTPPLCVFSLIRSYVIEILSMFCFFELTFGSFLTTTQIYSNDLSLKSPSSQPVPPAECVSFTV